MFEIGSKVQLVGVHDDDPGIVVESDHQYSTVMWGEYGSYWRVETDKLRLVEPENDSEQVEHKKVSKEAILSYLKNRSQDSCSSDLSAYWRNAHDVIEHYFDEIIKEDEKLEDADYKQYLKLKQRFEGN